MSLDAIMALEAVLRSKGNMNKREQEVVNSSISRATGDFLLGASISFAAVWSTFWAIPQIPRIFISGYAGLAGGRWTGGRKLEAQIENLLGLKGTRIQSELAALILTEFKNDKSLVKLVRKHFYPEQVFGDLNPDVSLFRWRPRNSYVDSASYFSQINQAHDKIVLSESAMDKNQSNSTIENSDGDLFADPLECVFGYSEEGNKETMNQTDATQVLSKKQIRAHKRAHRRRRSHDSDEPN